MILWSHHFAHLLLRICLAWIRFLGTSLGGIIAQVAILLLTEVQGGWGRVETWRTNWKGGLRRGIYALFWVWGLAFIFSSLKTVYYDHQELAARVHSLEQENEALKRAHADKGQSPFTISFDSEYSSIVNTVSAFNALVPQKKDKACLIKVTAPQENIQVARVLLSLAAAVGCRVAELGNPGTNPDARQEANNGAVRDSIVIHMMKNPLRDGFVTGMGNTFSVRRSYALPQASPQDLVWLQIGSGSPWRKHSTIAGTEE